MTTGNNKYVSLFSNITSNSCDIKSRLNLAKLHYLDGHYEFAIRELIRLKDFYQSETLDKLITSFGPIATPFLLKKSEEFSTGSGSKEPNEESVLGEIDIEADIAELLEELEEK